MFFEDEEFYEEENLDDYDLSDPFVRHYFSLDKENDFPERNELESAHSEQKPQYKSFTDIGSIDRSFKSELPSYGEARKGLTWSSSANSIKIRGLPPTKQASQETFKNSSRVYSLRDKKSRLLFGDYNRTVNIRPQMAPRRNSLSRNSVSNIPFQWLNSPSLSLWPALSLYKKFPSLNIVPLQKSESSVVTPPTKSEGSTLGTLNVATPPFYRWNQRNALKKLALGKERENRSFVLSRIPRNTRGEG